MLVSAIRDHSEIIAGGYMRNAPILLFAGGGHPYLAIIPKRDTIISTNTNYQKNIISGMRWAKDLGDG